LLVNVFILAYNHGQWAGTGPCRIRQYQQPRSRWLLLAACISLAFQLVCANSWPENQGASGKSAVVHNLLGKRPGFASLALEPYFFCAKTCCRISERSQPVVSSAFLLWVLARMLRLGVKRGRHAGRLRLFRALGLICSGMAHSASSWERIGWLPDTAFSARWAPFRFVIVACFVPRSRRSWRVRAGAAEPPSFVEAVQAIVFFVARSSSTISIF